MTAFANSPEPSATQTAASRTLNLPHMSLDFRSKAERYRRGFGAFLERHRDPLGLDGIDDPVAAYVERVWPDGLQSTCIVANASLGALPQWLIRPVADGPLAASYAAGHWAPALRAYQARGQLVVCGFENAPHVPPRPFEAQVSAVFHTAAPGPAMSQAHMAALASLPPHREKTEAYMDLWRRCLDWMEQLARINQVTLRYEAFDVGDRGVITFRIAGRHNLRTMIQRLGKGSMLAAPLDASASPEEWVPRPGQRPRFTHVGDVLRVESAGQGRPRHPSHAYDRHRGPDEPVPIVLRVEPAEAIREGDDDLPREGFLLLSIGGDLKPIKNARWAIDRFRNDQGFQPYMAGWLFDIRNAAEPLLIRDVPAGGPRLNNLDPDQWAAVAKALAAPEFFVLQGPPGTGKTTVIVEICVQEVRSGRRVLVSAQTNIAVDNVLDRLAHCPEVRPLRIAREERVEGVSRQYLPQNALGTWFQAVRGDCQERIEERRAARERAVVAQEALSRMREVLRGAEELREGIADLEAQEAQWRAERDSQRRAQDTVRQDAEARSRQRRALQDLARWLENPTTDPPSVEVITHDRIAERLSEVVRQLRTSLQTTPWALTWLPPSPPSQLRVGIGILQLACQAAEAAEKLEGPLFEASSLCRGQGHGDSAAVPRLRGLEAERTRLVDSEDQNELARLAEVNREIKGLRQGCWSAACRSILKPLADIFHGPPPEDLHELTSSLRPDARWIGTLDSLRDFAAQIRDAVHQLRTQQAEPLQGLLADEAEAVQGEIQARQDQARGVQDQIDRLDARLDDLRDRIGQARSAAEDCRRRWAALWPQTRWDARDAVPPAPAMGQDALAAREDAFRAWQQDHAAEQERHRRSAPILDAWVDRLGDKDGWDRPALHAQYARHANVVGITCYEAGRRDYYDHPDFEPFDDVIIDEVSKATPPELLAPILLGRKVILVGDHRQLPPMFKEREGSYQDALDEGQIQAEDFERYRNLVTASFFQGLFESAPDTLRHTLRRNHRSHPQIIEIINQFYDGQLVYGFGEAA